MRIKDAAYLTDKGNGRRSNQDGVLALKRVPLYAVADGTGSDDAARQALTVLKEQARLLTQRNQDVAATPNTTTRLAVSAFFQSAFQEANAALHRANEAAGGPHQATTLCAATVIGPYAFIAHVGDSRAYLLRDGELRCLTNDHTLAALQVRRGDITAAELVNSPFRSTLSQAAGMSPTLDVDVAEIRLMDGDQLLLCTNGLHRVVSTARMTRAFDARDADGRAADLIAAAHEVGAPDNTTAVVIEIARDPLAAPAPADVDQVVRDAFLFRDLPDAHWVRVRPYLEELTVGPGEIVCRSGDAAPAFYVLARGAVTVRSQGIERRDLAAPGHFGALALATTASPQLDDVTARAPSVLFALSRVRFEQLVQAYPALGTRLALALLESLGGRLGTLTMRLAQILELVQGRAPTGRFTL